MADRGSDISADTLPAGFNGFAEVEANVTEGAAVTMQAANAAPIARNDVYTTVGMRSIVVAAPGVLANDSDADGPTLRVTNHSQARNGAADVAENGRQRHAVRHELHLRRDDGHGRQPPCVDGG